MLTPIDFRGVHILRYRYIPKGQPGYDPLYKIRPFLTPLLHHFKEAYTLGREVSVDESMIALKFRISFIQYLPNKPHKWGMKAYVLTESLSGYTYSWRLYTVKQIITSMCVCVLCIHYVFV